MRSPEKRNAPPIEQEDEERETSHETGVKAEAREVTRGTEARTPFIVLAGVAGIVWIFIALVSGLVVLIWWLL